MKKIYLIDGNSFIYRMFFAIPEFTTSDGTHVNALFGMAKLFLWQFIKDNPDYLIFIKDAPGDNFRHEIYTEYKATRERMPDNLKSQIALIEEMIAKMWHKIVEIPGYEADDVIGTLATSLSQDKNNEIMILSWDKDLYSLISDNVKIYDTMKWKIYWENEAKEKFWVEPKHIIDYLSIVGDASDNIPGIAWFGPKKAIELISSYGSLEEIFLQSERDNFLFTGKTLDSLKSQKEVAFLSKQLATIPTDIEIPNFFLWDYVFQKDSQLTPEIKEMFVKYEFKSLYEEEKTLQKWSDLSLKVQTIQKNDDLQKLKSILKNYTEIFFDTETTSLDVIEAQLVGISLYLDDEHIYYINLWHQGEKISYDEAKDFLQYLFDLDVTIIGHNIKYDLEIIDQFLHTSVKSTWAKKEKEVWQMKIF